MIKKLSLALLLCAGAQLINAAVVDVANCTSTVFVPRSASTDLTWIDSLTFYNRTRRCSSKSYLYSSTTVYQQSRKNDHFGSGFLLGNGLNTVAVAQGGGTGIVNSIELGLGNAAPLAPFASTLTIQPTRKQFSYIGNMYFSLKDCWCGLWADFTFGVTNAHHRLNCCEVGNVSTACAGVRTVGDALGREELNSSKFFCNNCRDGKRRTGFEDVQVRLGYDYTYCDENRIGLYAIGTIPAGRSPTAEFIFEPLVGSKHASAGVGFLADYQFNFCGCDDSSLTLMTDFNYRFVFKHDECRTFDLIPNGPMSRYLLVVDQAAPGLPFPAANISTVRINVKPRSTIQWWIALNYEYCNWNFEAGYNLWWRQKEELSLKNNKCSVFPSTVGVYNVNGCGLSDVTASNATITNSGTPDALFVPLTVANLNLLTAAAGRALTNKVYGAVSWTGMACDCLEWITGFGGAYEFVSKHDRCNALQNWSVFGKMAIGF